MSNPFEQRYKQYSLDQLLEIVQFKHDYTPEAVAAAEDELRSRNASESELNAAQTELDERVAIDQAKKNIQRERNDTITQTLDGVAMELMPGNPKWKHPDRAITVISVFCMLIVTYGVFSDIPMIRYAMNVGLFYSGYAPILILYAVWLIAGILFYARYTLAWYTLMMLYVFAFIAVCSNLIVYQLGPQPFYFYENRSETNAQNLVGLLFFGSQLYVILRPELLKIYHINPRVKKILLSIAMAVGVIVSGITIIDLL